MTVVEKQGDYSHRPPTPQFGLGLMLALPADAKISGSEQKRTNPIPVPGTSTVSVGRFRKMLQSFRDSDGEWLPLPLNFKSRV